MARGGFVGRRQLAWLVAVARTVCRRARGARCRRAVGVAVVRLANRGRRRADAARDCIAAIGVTVRARLVAVVRVRCATAATGICRRAVAVIAASGVARCCAARNVGRRRSSCAARRRARDGTRGWPGRSWPGRGTRSRARGWPGRCARDGSRHRSSRRRTGTRCLARWCRAGSRRLTRRCGARTWRLTRRCGARTWRLTRRCRAGTWRLTRRRGARTRCRAGGSLTNWGPGRWAGAWSACRTALLRGQWQGDQQPKKNGKDDSLRRHGSSRRGEGGPHSKKDTGCMDPAPRLLMLGLR